jgi:hypothetical protein
MIKIDDILRPSRNSAYALRVSIVYPCGKFLAMYNPTSGRSDVKSVSTYDGWVIERSHSVVGTV